MVQWRIVSPLAAMAIPSSPPPRRPGALRPSLRPTRGARPPGGFR